MHGTFRNLLDTPDLEDSYQFNNSHDFQQPAKIGEIQKYGQIYCYLPFLVVFSVIFYVSSIGSYNTGLTAKSKSSILTTMKSPQESEVIFTSSSDFAFRTTNEYGSFKGPYSYFADYPGAQLIEPYKLTTFTLTGVSKNRNYLWEIESLQTTFEGTEISLKISSVSRPTLNIKIHAYDLKNNYISTYKSTLIVKYVKRDIRSLTLADRESFLNAAHKIWQYSTEEGRAIYGDSFTGIHTYVKEHARASEDIMCDGYHEGSGFLTRHLALSNSFEAALRAVDPSVTLPYWDFSQEGQIISDLGETPSHLLKISPVFTNEWFGEVDENNHIANSRWAHGTMPKSVTSDVEVTTSSSVATIYPTNSYGYYRSYWNNNPDEEVTRSLFNVCGTEDIYKPIATCQIHYNVLNLTTLAEFQTLSPTDGHGPLHVQIGGVYGGCSAQYLAFTTKWNAYLNEDLSEEFLVSAGQTYKSFINKWGSTAQRKLMLEKVVMSEFFRVYRSLWRSHMCAVDGSAALLECPTSCDTKTQSFEECGCSVPKLTSGETTWQNLLPCIIFSEENRKFFAGTMSDEFMADLTTFIATASVKEGEMMHSGSPADIMFWMIHPIIERLLAAKRLTTVTSMGGVPFYKWNNEEMDSTSNNWLSYSYYNLETGVNKFHPEAYTCEGHAADDAVLPTGLPFTSILTESADLSGDGVVSNWEFYLALDPNRVDANDYVFDHFEWSHCTEGTIGTSTISDSRLILH